VIAMKSKPIKWSRWPGPPLTYSNIRSMEIHSNFIYHSSNDIYSAFWRLSAFLFLNVKILTNVISVLRKATAKNVYYNFV